MINNMVTRQISWKKEGRCKKEVKTIGLIKEQAEWFIRTIKAKTKKYRIGHGYSKNVKCNLLFKSQISQKAEGHIGSGGTRRFDKGLKELRGQTLPKGLSLISINFRKVKNDPVKRGGGSGRKSVKRKTKGQFNKIFV